MGRARPVLTRILVVDDDPGVLELFEKRLEAENREVVTLDSAEEALRRISGENWDLLITDIRMPGVDGFSLIETAAQKLQGVPCIAVTGYSSDTTLYRALETDCFAYLNKPFDWNHLNLLVDKAIRLSTRSANMSVWNRNVK